MNHQDTQYLAPELQVGEWLNCESALHLSNLKGKVVVIYAFQMLCPGCVSHGIPQALMIEKLYRQDSVQVIGLHTVFEHHSVMTADALAAFIHEYHINFPVAIDRPAKNSAIPHTMQSYQMKGTPTLIIIDKKGRVRQNYFGRMGDMQVGNLIGRLLEENMPPLLDCNEEGCAIGAR